MSNSEHLDVGFERVALWDAPLDPSERSCLDVILKTWPSGARTVVDVGSGDARVTRHFPSSLDVLKVDRNAAALSRAPGRTLVADISRIPLDDGSFDVAMCSNVLEHLSVDILDAAASELRRLAQDHILIVGPLSEPLDQGLTRCRQCGTRFHPNGHIQSLSVGAIEGLLAPEFELRERAVTEQVWRTVDRVTQAAELTMGADLFAWPHAVCPACTLLQGVVDSRPSPVAAAALRMVIEPNPRTPAPLEAVLWFQRSRGRRRRRRSDPGIIISARKGGSEDVKLEWRFRGLAYADSALTEHPAAVGRGAFLVPEGATWGGVERCVDGRLRRPLVGADGLVVLPVSDVLAFPEIELEVEDTCAGVVQVSVFDARGVWRDLEPMVLTGSGGELRRRLGIGADWLPPLASTLVRVRVVDWKGEGKLKFGHIGVVDPTWKGAPPIHVTASPAAFVSADRVARGRGEYLVASCVGGELSVREIDPRGVSTFWGSAESVSSPPVEPWDSDPDPADCAAAFEAVVLAGACGILAGTRRPGDEPADGSARKLVAELREAASRLSTRPAALLSAFTDLFDRLVSRTDALDLQNSELQRQIEEMHAERLNVQEQLDACGTQLKMAEERLGEALSARADVTAKLLLVESQNDALEVENTSLHAKIKSTDQRAAGFEERLRVALSRAQELAGAVMDAEHRADCILADARIVIEDQRNATRGALEIASAAERDLYASLGSMNEVRRSVLSLERQILSCAEELHEQATANELQVRAQQSALSELNSRAARLESERDAAQLEVSLATARLESERDAAQLEVSLATARLEEAIASLERVSAGALAAATRRDALAVALRRAKASPFGWLVSVPRDLD